MPECSVVGVTTGQFLPRMCRKEHTFLILPWKEIFLGSITGSSPAGKIVTCLLPFRIFLLNSCLPLNTVTTSPRLEKAGLTAWSLMSSGRRMVTKIGSLPFLRGPTRLRKLRQVSESPKRNWISVSWSFSFAVLDPRPKTNFEEETLYRAAISLSTLNGLALTFPRLGQSSSNRWSLAQDSPQGPGCSLSSTGE